ncbi:hypothetical protein Q7P35_009761 [Cladosporium inversicolor]
MDVVNAKIAAVVEAVGPKVKFVDYDSLLEKTNSHFCKKGVDETRKVNNARDSLKDSNARTTMRNLPNLLLDRYGRVFHLQILLHQLIADTTIEEILQSEISDEVDLDFSVGPFCEMSQIQPAGGSAVAYAVWFKDISDKADKNVGFLTLTPSDAQVETWKVKYRREEIPIGATGLWRPFVAIDIFGQVTPEAEITNREDWRSLADLVERYENPFEDGSDVKIFFITKETLAKQSVGTYAYSDTTMDQRVKGSYIVQYTPYDHSLRRSCHACRPQAKVRVYYENYQTLVIDKTWETLTTQRNLKRDRSDEICEGDNRGEGEDEGGNEASSNSGNKGGQQVALATYINLGANMDTWAQLIITWVADTLLTAEVSYATYTSSAGVATVAKLAKKRNVGILYITDDVEPNPYDSIPNDAYMQTFIDTVPGRGLEPNTAYSFTILTVSPSGLKSRQSTAATIKTLALPRKGRTVSSTSVSASANQAVYSAEILVPYTFVRLFL